MGDARPVFVFGIGLCPPGKVVFHLYAYRSIDRCWEKGLCPTDPDHQRWVMRTACGRIVFVDGCNHPDSDRWGHRYAEPADRLRRDQAELLGRCCKVCEAHDEG